jgi:hypothetical protein
MKFRSVRDIIVNLEDWWPWHFSGDDDEKEKVDMNLNPVLLVPGIGGSILNAVDKNGRKERIWVRLFEADHEFRTKLYSFYNPETGTILSAICRIPCNSPSYSFALRVILYNMQGRVMHAGALSVWLPYARASPLMLSWPHTKSELGRDFQLEEARVCLMVLHMMYQEAMYSGFPSIEQVMLLMCR